jgi:hypothetical protein
MAALRTIAGNFERAMGRWAAISTKDLVEVNRELKAAGLAEIVLEEAKVEDDDAGDDDVG